MTRLGLLVAIALMVGGCSSGTPAPGMLQGTAYADPEATVRAPGIEGGTLSLGGVWSASRMVCFDLVVEAPADTDAGELVPRAFDDAFSYDGPDRWFELRSRRGEVELRSRSVAKPFGAICVLPMRPQAQVLDAPPGRRRWAFSAWYSVPGRLGTGSYRLHVSGGGSEASSAVRAAIGLWGLDGMSVQVRPYEQRPTAIEADQAPEGPDGA